MADYARSRISLLVSCLRFLSYSRPSLQPYLNCRNVNLKLAGDYIKDNFAVSIKPFCFVVKELTPSKRQRMMQEWT